MNKLFWYAAILFRFIPSSVLVAAATSGPAYVHIEPSLVADAALFQYIFVQLVVFGVSMYSKPERWR
jgi:hypothetical protein